MCEESFRLMAGACGKGFFAKAVYFRESEGSFGTPRRFQPCP